MILQAEEGCWLTEAADVTIEQRHYALTVPVRNAKEAESWKQVTDEERKKMLAQGTIFDIDQLSGEYLDKVDMLLTEIPAHINERYLPAADALRHKGYYPVWGDINAPMGKEIPAGFRLTHGDVLYESTRTQTLTEGIAPGQEVMLLQADVTTIMTCLEDMPRFVPVKERYTWVKYADDAAGNGMSDDPAGKLYIGIATGKESEQESDDPTDYQWSKLEESQEMKVEDGNPSEPVALPEAGIQD